MLSSSNLTEARIENKGAFEETVIFIVFFKKSQRVLQVAV